MREIWTKDELWRDRVIHQTWTLTHLLYFSWTSYLHQGKPHGAEEQTYHDPIQNLLHGVVPKIYPARGTSQRTVTSRGWVAKQQSTTSPILHCGNKPRLSITDLSRSLGQTWSGKPGFEASRILPADRDKDGSSYSNESCETLPHIVPDTSGEYGPEGARTSTQSHGVQTLRRSYTTQLQQLQYIWPQSWTMGPINP